MPGTVDDILSGDMYFNGINAVTGEYGQPPLSPRRLSQLIQGKPTQQDYQAFVARQRRLGALTKLSGRLTRVTEDQNALTEADQEAQLEELKFKVSFQDHIQSSPVKPGAGNPSSVSEVGWAILFPADMNPTLREDIKEALRPLLELRKQQAGDKFRVYDGGSAYRPGERKDRFFERMGVSPGFADPEQMPFYVLLVGSPNEIPYQFQYQLDVMRGVGRLDFGENLDAYHQYALNVVAAETGQVVLPRRMGIFGSANPGDKATRLSAQYLASPLSQNLRDPSIDLALSQAWEILPPQLGPGKGTKDALLRMLGGNPEMTPALLMTATHGVEFPANHPEQMRYQGALLCQDWPGPGSPVRRDHFVAGEDISSDSNMLGMIAMLFACYGAGTPELDQFAMQAFAVREKIAPRGFTAALPSRMLQQGALAVLAHVERAWGYSFISPTGQPDIATFVTAMRMLMNGEPVGLATDTSFNGRYAAMSSDLSVIMEELKWNEGAVSDFELASVWTASNDARGYVVLGDPAVRIPFSKDDALGIVRPDLDAIIVPDFKKKSEPVSVLPKEQRTDEAVTQVMIKTAPEETVPVNEVPVAPSPVVEPTLSGQEIKAGVSPSVEAAQLRPQRQVRPVDVQRMSALGSTSPAVAFGLSDQFEKLRSSLQQFTDELADSIGDAAKDVVSLDVRTYVTDDLVALSKALLEHETLPADLQALTRVGFDGDIEVYVPSTKTGAVDLELWEVHTLMVKEAQTNRAKFLQTVAELAASLMYSLSLKP